MWYFIFLILKYKLLAGKKANHWLKTDFAIRECVEILYKTEILSLDYYIDKKFYESLMVATLKNLS